MKFKQLNETILIEKEVKGAPLKDIELSKTVSDAVEAGSWQDAFNQAESSVAEQELFVVFVDYVPTKQHNDVSMGELVNRWAIFLPRN